MRNIVKIPLAVAGFMALATTFATAGQDSERAKIETVLQTYESALNASDTEKVMSVYAADGVFMPQNRPSQVGAKDIRNAYTGIFKAINLNIRFKLAEVRTIAPDWAFARSNSAGTITINATGKKKAAASQELFVLRKNTRGNWKIARYSFSTTLAPSS